MHHPTYMYVYQEIKTSWRQRAHIYACAHAEAFGSMAFRPCALSLWFKTFVLKWAIFKRNRCCAHDSYTTKRGIAPQRTPRVQDAHCAVHNTDKQAFGYTRAEPGNERERPAWWLQSCHRMPNIPGLKGQWSLANWAVSTGTPERWQGIQTRPCASHYRTSNLIITCAKSRWSVSHIWTSWTESGRGQALPSPAFFHPSSRIGSSNHGHRKYRRPYMHTYKVLHWGRGEPHTTYVPHVMQLITDSWDEGGIECIFREAHEDTRLSHATVSNQQQLEQEVVRFGHVVPGSRPVHRPRTHAWEAHSPRKASSKENGWTGRLYQKDWAGRAKRGKGGPLPIRFTVTWTVETMT